MKLSPRRLPSPALVIACVALFVSLGGVSYGVATGFIDSREIKNNTIRSKDVRNNTLRTFDIRNNEVRGFDIRNSSIQGRDVAFNTLTGQDVAESSLGKVPSAAAADSATTAGTAGSVAVLKTIAPTGVAEGAAPVTLAAHGPLTLLGACVDQAGQTTAVLRVQTTEASSGASGAGNEVFGPGTADLVEVADPAVAPRTVQVQDASAFAPSGKSLTAQFGIAADSVAQSCLFHGEVTLQG